ncbi:hypothetical protein M758_4G089000 [Ceratodon purpureus]|nr:hypothetical protein M758_4G089000 [Ceratodon purpureus]
MTGRAGRGRSRVLLSDSSSEDDDPIEMGNAEGNAGAVGVEAMLLEDDIEDDDISVEDVATVFPPAQAPARVSRVDGTNMSRVEGGGSPLHQQLRRRGVSVHSEWVGSFVREMEGSHPGFSALGVERQGELALAHLLVADFNDVGAGCLPNSFEAVHATELPGPFVLQVDEVSDIGAPLRERYHERGAGLSRCLKLSMTDGVQRVVGIEYQPIPALHNLFPAGIKICLRNIFVRRGVFLLTCDSVEVIGGLVQRLEEARQRAVHEVNKPARGSRNRRGQTGDRSLIERATAEAWPRNTDGANPVAAGILRDNSSGHSAQPVQPTAASIFQSFAAQGQPARSHQAPQVPDTGANVGHSLHASRTETRFNVSVQQATPAVAPTHSETRSNIPVQQVAPAAGQICTETRSNVTVHQTTTAVGPTIQTQVEVKRKQTTIPWVQTSANDAGLKENSPRRPTNSFGPFSTQQRVVEQTTARDSFAQPSAAGMQTPMNLDSDEDEFQSIPTPLQRHRTPVFNEEPFTYLAFLKEKRSTEPGNDGAAGKVKCILTGVKEFRYKDTEEFALFVTIDDGSLATMALIHHEVVQKKVGFSPKEVNSALDGKNSQEIREMKAIMKRFETFLRNFEGIVYVQYKQSFDMPVISYMEEGVKAGDLSALRNRVSNDTSLRPRGVRHNSEVIDVSP